MCGRTALTLGQPVIVNACAYKKKNEKKYRKPVWKEENNLGRKYNPSPNIAPTTITPVLVSGRKDGENDYAGMMIKPMMWGMVPPWHKGSYKNHGLSTNNCRLETILSSKLYGSALREGNRCVILAEGFYEWQTANKSKQPYYIFSPENDSSQMFNAGCKESTFNESDGWNGIKLLKMAGLYNTWECDEGVLYSYSIITMESNDTMSWIHHRMPAILETDDEVLNWLDIENISYKDAVSILKPAKALLSYPVSTIVNNSRNNEIECNKPTILGDSKEKVETPVRKPVKAKNVGSTSIMNAWLKRKPADNTENAINSDVKKFKAK